MADGTRSWGWLLAIVVLLALTPVLLRLPPVVALATTLVLGVLGFVPTGKHRGAVEGGGAGFDHG